MYKKLFSVGGWTLVSRLTGFFRDVMLGAVLGAGPLADAFYIAFRLPNHFRAILGEGAFNAAFVPVCAGVLERGGEQAARLFTAKIQTILVLVNLALLMIALTATGPVLAILAPGIEADPQRYGPALMLTRITFPYLLFVSLVTLHTAVLNLHDRFAAGAFAPVLLNLVMIACLALAFVFPDAGVAASVGVTLSGVAQLALVMTACARAGLLSGLARLWPAGPEMGRFFRALGPAVIGSAGVQIAMFADTIIASLLPAGAVSAIYYADRLYQLPIGVIGMAAGTILLPQMSRLLARGATEETFAAQNRTTGLIIALTLPFMVAFWLIPDLVIRAVFLRGHFTPEAAQAAAQVLAAYAPGLLAIVLIAPGRASFQARGDTRTPMIVALVATAGNVLLKILLYRDMGAAGLALSTAIGACLNFVGLLVLAWRAGWFKPDRALWNMLGAGLLASTALAGVALLGRAPLTRLVAPLPLGHDEALLILLGLAGLAVYTGVFLAARALLSRVLLAGRDLPPSP